LDNSEYDYVG